MTKDDISAVYTRLGYKYGWTFMMTREARLADSTVCLVGLNPAGTEAGEEIWSCEHGNAYHVERNWGGPGTSEFVPLQVQVQEVARILRLGEDDYLAAQFIPFRSKNYRSLPNAKEALAFANELWKWVMGVSSARSFLCLGKEVAWHLTKMTCAEPCLDHPILSVGWGRATISCYKTAGDDGHRRTIVGLPHLSWYKVFDRKLGRSELAEQSLRQACGL